MNKINLDIPGFYCRTLSGAYVCGPFTTKAKAEEAARRLGQPKPVARWEDPSER
jgi:hypothetical protein